MKIQPGACVIVSLHEPKEKFWGLLEEINAAGVFVRGIDLNSYEELLRLLVHAEEGIYPATMFFPLRRVERILLMKRRGQCSRSASALKSAQVCDSPLTSARAKTTFHTEAGVSWRRVNSAGARENGKWAQPFGRGGPNRAEVSELRRRFRSSADNSTALARRIRRRADHSSNY